MKRLCILAKAPIPGKVKTRMSPPLTAQQSAELQKRLLKRTLNTAFNSQADRIELWTSLDCNHDSFLLLTDQYREVSLKRQPGGDLGTRMAACFNNDPEESTVVIGTDCPSLTQAHLNDAFAAVVSSDCHFIPAFDGGYVLVASNIVPQCFEGIEWGSDRVLEQTRKALAAAGQTISCQPPLPDLDRVQDISEHSKSVLSGLGLEKWQPTPGS